MKFVCPLIVVKDVQRSRKFYENVLGQTVKFDFDENIQFEGGFAIHLESHFKKLIPGHDIKKQSNSFELYFETDALEDINAKLEEENIEFIHKIAEQPWGQRVMRFYDLDRHIIEIGESLESVVIRFYKQGLSTNEISQKTSMLLDFVESTINNCK